MEKVPNEILERIFDLLDPLGAFTCEKVCVRWRHIMRSYWAQRMQCMGRNAHKFSLEAFGYLIREDPSDPLTQVAQVKRILILQHSLEKIHKIEASRKEYQFKLSTVGVPSIGGRHICGKWLLVLNWMPSNGGTGHHSASSTGHSNNPPATGNNTSVSAAAASATPKNTTTWQLNIYHILSGKLLKSIPNIKLSHPCIAGCCFDGSQTSSSLSSSSSSSLQGGHNRVDTGSASVSSQGSLFDTIWRRGAGASGGGGGGEKTWNNNKPRNPFNETISAVVLFERERTTNESKVVVIKAPFGPLPSSSDSGGADNRTSTGGDANGSAANESSQPPCTGLREFYFTTTFKQSQSTIRVFDHLLVATYRHQERIETELQVHHLLDYGSRVLEWKRWIVPEQVWRVEFKDESVFALACRTKVLFFDVLNGSYQTIFCSTQLPKTRLFIGMNHVMFASDYGSKPAVILPINAADVRSVNDSSPHSPTSPPGAVSGGRFGGPCCSGSSSEAVMIDSIKWRDLSFKSASIGCTVLVDSPDENQFTLMNLDCPSVKLLVAHPNINTRDCELCGISIIGHHLLVVLRNFKQNYCQVVKFDLFQV